MTPTAPPRIVYDDDCGFCRWAVDYADRHGEFELVRFSDVTPDQSARLPDRYENCVHLLTDDAVYSCGAATEEILARLDGVPRAGARAFRLLPESRRARVREPVYRWVADHRAWFGRLRSR